MGKKKVFKLAITFKEKCDIKGFGHDIAVDPTSGQFVTTLMESEYTYRSKAFNNQAIDRLLDNFEMDWNKVDDFIW